MLLWAALLSRHPLPLSLRIQQRSRAAAIARRFYWRLAIRAVRVARAILAPPPIHADHAVRATRVRRRAVLVAPAALVTPVVHAARVIRVRRQTVSFRGWEPATHAIPARPKILAIRAVLVIHAQPPVAPAIRAIPVRPRILAIRAALATCVAPATRVRPPAALVARAIRVRRVMTKLSFQLRKPTRPMPASKAV